MIINSIFYVFNFTLKLLFAKSVIFRYLCKNEKHDINGINTPASP